ncbi:hypothetical protein JCM3775_000163 [Rhodotorula graminis]
MPHLVNPPPSSSLPLIDLSPFLSPKPDPDAHRNTARKLHSACLDYGFFYCTGLDSVVSPDDMRHALDVARAFFNTPDDDKLKLRIKPGDGARGYQRIGENVTQYKKDWHEGWDAYKPLPPSLEDPSKLLHGPNQWPAEPASFRPVLERWVDKMHTVGHALMEATAMALGIDVDGDAKGDESGEWARMKSWVADPFWVMRCIGYPPLPPDAEGVSCGAHKDYGNFTLLHADSTPGALQVFLPSPSGPDSTSTGERGTWIDANPVEGAFVVNVGEMVEVYSAGLYKATLHRVVHKSETYRVSIPFFFEPTLEALIEPLPSAVRLRRELLGPDSAATSVKPVIYGDFLRSKVSNNFALEDKE